MMVTLLVIVFLACCLVLFEWLLPRTTLPLSWQRKLIHVSICFVVAGLSFFLSYHLFFLIGLFFTVALLLLRRFRPLESLADRRDVSFGEIFLPLGVALAALLAQTSSNFQIALLLLGVADTAAYIAGNLFASPRLVLHKTLAGSAAYMLAAAILLTIFRPLPIAVLFGCVLGVTELISPKGSDNLTTPLAAVLLLGGA